METKNNLPVRQSDVGAAERTPEQYAKRINDIKYQTSAIFQAAVNEGKRSSILIGRLLEEAKCLVPHGEWGTWLRDNVEYSESTANNLMRCYREFGDEQIDMISGVSDAEFFSVLTQSQMVELFALPKADRRTFVEEHREELESGDMSTRDMKKEIERLTSRERELAEENERLKNVPPPEPVVQEVFVNQPSPEQIDKIREEERKAAEERAAAEKQAIQMRLTTVEGQKKTAEDALSKAKKAREKAEAALDKEQAASKKAAEEHQKQIAMMIEEHRAEMEAAEKSSAEGNAAVAEAVARVAELEKALKVANPAVSEFKALFDATQGMVKKMHEKLDKIKEQDPETADKLGKALETLAGMVRGKS